MLVFTIISSIICFIITLYGYKKRLIVLFLPGVPILILSLILMFLSINDFVIGKKYSDFKYKIHVGEQSVYYKNSYKIKDGALYIDDIITGDYIIKNNPYYKDK